MYIVRMTVYSVTLARARLADLLDAAERGERVIIERRGVRHAVTLEEPVSRSRARRPRLEVLDADIEAGTWSWAWRADGVVLRSRSRKKR